jgi:mycofactocin system glycosyltransferase
MPPLPLPSGFRLELDPSTRLERGGAVLLGGEPFALVRLGPDQMARVQAWRDGAPVSDGGTLARVLVERNLAQPVPPPAPLPPVTAVVPVRDRPAALARLLAALDAAETIVVDDGSLDGDAIRAVAERAGARYLRRGTRGGAAAARNDGLAAARHALVALVDSDCVPRPGWLAAVLPHFADPQVSAVAPRIVALPAPGALARYEAARSPLDRGASRARVVPGGRVPFVPAAALVVRAHLRFDETLRSGGEDVDFVWRAPYVRYEPAAQVAHDHRTTPCAWLARRVYYGRTAAPLARRHPANARPLAGVSPWTTAAWVAAGLGHPRTAVAITATATALFARELRADLPEPARIALELAGLGTLRSGRVVADALTRAWWPLSLAAAVAVPRLRPALAVAALASARPPLKLADDVAYGAGVWIGCLRERDARALLPAAGWRLTRLTPR